MKKTMKKVLALVLSVIMCVSFVLPAMAEGATSGCPGVGVAHTLVNCTNYETYKTYAPTCEKDGYTHYQCKVCSVFFADSWVDRPNTDGLCKWEVTTKASCFADGVKTCKNCGATEAIEKRAHVMAPVDGSPECGVPGAKITRKCTNTANANYLACTHTDEVDAGNVHDWNITVTVQPSCGVKGEAKYTCEDCGFYKTMEIYSTNDHDFEDVEAKEMICGDNEEAGHYAHQKCKNCDAVKYNGQIVDYEDVVIEIAHTFDANTPTSEVAPTCTTPGFKFYGCTKCGGVADTVVIDPLPHITNKADNGKDGSEGKEITLTGTVTTAIDCTKNQNQVTTYTCVGNGKDACGFQWTQTTLVVGSDAAEEAGHVISEVVVDPNCTDGGYTYKTCAVCGKIGENYALTNPVAGAHAWSVSQPINAPTCTTPGSSVSYCTKCQLVDDNHVEEALGHTWERGEDPLDGHTYVYDCKNGVLVYTCTDTNCDDTANNKTTAPIDEDFDIDDIKWHRDYDAEDETWTGATPSVVRNRDCTVSGLTIYTCSCGYGVLVEEAAGHNLTETTVYKAPTCLADGNYGEWSCSTCNGKVYTLANGDEHKFVAADSTTPFVNVIPMLSTDGNHLNKTVYKQANDPTCEDEGNTEGWYCNVCCDFVADADEDPEDDDAPTITLKSGAVNSAEKPAFELSTVIYPLDHKDKYIDDWANLTTNPDGTFVIENDRIVRVPTCLEYAYAHYVCPDCGLEYWDDYKKELGHDTEEVVISADCDNGGYNLVVCKRGDLCDLTATTYGEASYKVVEEEEVGRLYHKDADGNTIKCVFEDFYCSVCSPDALVDWEKSHDYESTHYTKTCVSYGYTLISCTTCHDGKVIENTVDGFGGHSYGADPDCTVSGHYDEGDWTVTKAPTYAAAGSRYQKCITCGKKVTDNNYVKTDMKLTFTTTNAKNDKANVVNSGIIALTVKTHAYKLPVWGLELSIKYNNQLVAFEGFEVNNASFKETTKVASKNAYLDNNGVAPEGYVDRDDVVTVLAYAGNGTDGKAQNVELNGDGTALVTVYFRVLDNTYGATAAFEIVENSVEVVDKAAKEKTVSSVGTIPSVAIKALGDVNGDIDYTAAGVATVQDAIALQLIVDKNDNTYNAMADIDKDGNVTVVDFGYLMQYISGEIDYNELCAIGVKA